MLGQRAGNGDAEMTDEPAMTQQASSEPAPSMHWGWLAIVPFGLICYWLYASYQANAATAAANAAAASAAASASSVAATTSNSPATGTVVTSSTVAGATPANPSSSAAPAAQTVAPSAT